MMMMTMTMTMMMKTNDGGRSFSVFVYFPQKLCYSHTIYGMEFLMYSRKGRYLCISPAFRRFYSFLSLSRQKRMID